MTAKGGYQYLRACDGNTGVDLWDGPPVNTIGGSQGMYCIKDGYVYFGLDHASGGKINIETGIKTKLDGYGGPDPGNGFLNCDADGIYCYGDDGVDSPYIKVKSLSNADTVRWQNSREKKQFQMHWYMTYWSYTAFGHPCIHGNSLFVPDGILWEYDKLTGTVLWQTGVRPRNATLGSVCYHAEVIYSDGLIFTFGRECLVAPNGSVPPVWSIPRLYIYDAITKQLIRKIDLPDFVAGYFKGTCENAPFFVQGDTFWDFTGDGKYLGMPFEAIVRDGVVYVSCFDRIMAIRFNTGELIWNFQKVMPTDWFTSPDWFGYFIQNVGGKNYWISSSSTYKDVGDIILSGNILYASHRLSNEIIALNILNGQRMWSFKSDISTDYFTGMIVSNGKLYASTLKGRLYCLEGQTINQIPAPPEGLQIIS